MEIAMIGVAALITLEPDHDRCKEAGLALATAAPTPIRAQEAEKVLASKKLDHDVIASAAQSALYACSPRTSWRTTAEYRRDVIPVLVQRAIQAALIKLAK